MMDIKKAISYIQNMDLSIFAKKQEAEEVIDLVTSILEKQLNNGWIPVSEGLPETNKDVLITFREFMEWNKKYRHGTCKAIYISEHSIKIEDMGWVYEDVEEYDELEDVYYVKSGWYEVIENWDDYTHVYINCEVTAWQPLPEPYKGVSDETNTI